MSIEKFEFLEDRVRVYYHLQKPWGISDVDSSIDVLYVSIDKLPKLPERIGVHGGWGEDITIPHLGRTITFMFDSYQERSMGPLEEDMYGPYLKEESLSAP